MESTAASEDPPLSKNKLKKLKRDQAWEAGRENRKLIRKEKNRARKEKKRVMRDLTGARQPDDLQDRTNENDAAEPEEVKDRRRPQHIQVPITIVIDCGFDDLMLDTERKSLGSQITRCYSDNHKAPYQAHLVISSFGGHLKERFDSVLAGHHRSWKGVKFLEQDFVDAANQAEAWMRGLRYREIPGALASNDTRSAGTEEQSRLGETIYLTSDSPHTLSSLSPYSTYIIGGIVDKNRHKGICYKKAMDRGIKTAKLPIDDYMRMSSRFVLATNHVCEIMLRWLEGGTWSEAFMKVMPKRKGGVLKPQREEQSVNNEACANNETEAPALEEAVESINGNSNVEVDDASTGQDAPEEQDSPTLKQRCQDTPQPDGSLKSSS